MKGMKAHKADEMVKRTLRVLDHIWDLRMRHAAMSEEEKLRQERGGFFLDFSQVEIPEPRGPPKRQGKGFAGKGEASLQADLD